MHVIRVFDRVSLFLLVPTVFYLLCLPWKERKKDSRQCPDRKIAQSTQLRSTCFRGLIPLENLIEIIFEILIKNNIIRKNLVFVFFI